MDNSSYRSQYIQSGNENISEKSIAVYDAFWKRLQKSEDAVGKPMEDGYTTEEYVRLIDGMNVSNISAFLTYKSKINRYLKWLNGKGLLDQEFVDNLRLVKYDMVPSYHVYDTKYFKDFPSLQQAIEDTLWRQNGSMTESSALKLLQFIWPGADLQRKRPFRLKRMKCLKTILIHPAINVSQMIR